MTKEYVDKAICSIEIIDFLIAKCDGDSNISLDKRYIPFLQLAIDCIKETLYEEIVDE